MYKKAQIWGMDLVIAGVLFAIAITFFYLYAINSGNEVEDKLQSLTYEAGVLSEMILSEGYPSDWNETSVIQIGILTNGKIDEEKLEKFYNMSIGNYYSTKNKLNTRYDFYFFFDENMTIANNVVDGIGKAGFDRYTTSQDNLIKLNRIVIYKERIMGASLYIWG